MANYIDPRDRELAQLLVHHSVKAKKGELVYIHCVGASTLGLGAALVEEVAKAGAAPYLQPQDDEILSKYIATGDDDSFKRLAQYEAAQMTDADCYIGIRGSDNIFEMAGVPKDRMKAYRNIIYRPVHLELRVKKTRWCVLRYPNSSMAQLAKQSKSDFADFYYKVCCVDYNHMAKAVEPLAKMMKEAKIFHYKGPGTDLVIDTGDYPVRPCTGEHNIPDGECFTTAKRDGVNGTVHYNAPSVYDGIAFDDIKLRFEKGVVVEATAADADQTTKLNEILDRDEGARHIGEVAIGFNPVIKHAMRDILFDEKIGGSFHNALGEAYEDCDNGNRSSIHWDMVCIQRPEYGGGEIWFDDKLIRKDGLFVVDELKGLNPDAY